MKIRSLAALLLAAILLLGGCTPPMGPDDGTIPPVSDTVGESGTDTAADTSPDTETPSEEETEPQPEPPPALSLAAHTLTAEGDNIVLSLSCLLRDDTVTGELICKLADAKGEIAEQRVSVSAAPQEISLPCPDGKSKEKLTITVDAVTADGETADSLYLTMENGIVQLTEDSVACVVAAMTLEEKAKLTSGAATTSKRGAVGATLALRKYGIPAIGFNDGPACVPTPVPPRCGIPRSRISQTPGIRT